MGSVAELKDGTAMIIVLEDLATDAAFMGANQEHVVVCCCSCQGRTPEKRPPASAASEREEPDIQRAPSGRGKPLHAVERCKQHHVSFKFFTSACGTADVAPVFLQEGPRPEPCDETLIINELIREYLVWHGLRDTLSVFIPGTGWQCPGARQFAAAAATRHGRQIICGHNCLSRYTLR